MSFNDSFVVFYSNQCEHCKSFLTQLKGLGNGLFEKFTKICVDGNVSIPKSIQSVPTILVPSHSHPLTDNSVFMWLETMSSQYGPTPTVQSTQATPSVQQIHPSQQQAMGPPQGGQQGQSQGVQPPDSDEGIVPYVAGEMGNCFSDSFSFLDSTPQPLAHSFSFLDGSAPTGQPGGLGGPQGNPMAQVSADNIGRPSMQTQTKSSSSFDVAYESYMNSREGDMAIPQQPRRVG